MFPLFISNHRKIVLARKLIIENWIPKWRLSLLDGYIVENMNIEDDKDENFDDLTLDELVDILDKGTVYHWLQRDEILIGLYITYVAIQL